jgi:hypothetical protein
MALDQFPPDLQRRDTPPGSRLQCPLAVTLGQRTPLCNAGWMSFSFL